MDRQYMPYFPPGSGRYPPQVKEEPDYSKMGYEDAPGGTFGIKREPGVGFEEPPGGFAANVKVEEPAIKQEFVEPKQETPDERRGEKRQAVNQYGSPEPKRYRPEMGKDHVEDEPEYDKNEVLLDWYNSDLSLKISKDNFLSAQPLTSDGFGYVWHGVRATYGFSHGRVFFEVKVEDHLPVPQLEVEEQHPHVMRCGWSIDDAGLTLGEEPFSYGYGGTAKASTALKFKDYGRPFGKGDVVGCFLDMDSEPIIISFTLNGRNLGMCYEVSHRSLQDKALFPHILTKNCSFKVNFGSEHPWFQPLTRYTFVGHVPLQERVLGTQGPETRQDSEVIMMVGLPACGKTTWIEKYCKENPAKKYYILGTNALIDKMKVNGLPRKRNYHGRWDVLIGKCTNCLNKLLDMSYKRRRNFIIDQTNVYPSARKRKMKGFPGFFRRAMVVCPSDAELKRRTEKQISQEGKNVPDSAIMEMKANFTLPEEEDDHFDSVEFTDLPKEEAAKVVEQYSNDAQSAGFVKNRPPRGRGGSGGGGGGGGNFRGGWNRDRRGGFNDRQDRSSSGGNQDRSSSGGNQDRSSSGGNQDNRGGSNNRGGYSRDSFGGNNRDFGRGSDSSRGGFGRDNWGSDGNRGGFGRGGGGDSNRGGFSGRGGDSNRGGFGGRGSFGGNNRDNRDFGRDNGSGQRGYGRDSYGGNDRNTQTSRDSTRSDDNSYGGFSGSRDSQRGFDNNRSRFSTESFGGNSRGGFGQDNLGGNRDMPQGGFGQESLGGNRDMPRGGFNMDNRDNRGSNSSHGGYSRDNYSGSNKDLDRGYNNMDNRDNTNGGSDARGGFNRDSQRGMDRDYSRSGSDSWGGFSGSTRSFSSDRGDRDSRGDGDSRGGYNRGDSYGGSSRDGQRGYGGSYDSSRSMGTTRGSHDHSDSSGYSSLSSSTSSLSSAQSYGSGSWNRQYSQQQYWGQSDGGYGSQQSSGSSQQSYGRSTDRSSSPAVGGGGSGGGGSSGGGGGGAGAGAGGGGGGWQQGNSGNWGGGGSGSGNPQWNYGSSYRGQRQ